MSKTTVSRGDSNARWMAMVSSTTPRFGPRWPPVRETSAMRCARISAASSGTCSGDSALTSLGERIPVSNVMPRSLVVGGHLGRAAGP